MPPSLPVPPPELLALLTPVERWNFRLADLVMRRARRLAMAWNTSFMVVLTWLATSRRLHVHGLEHVAWVQPADRLLLVANHRSFFDFFQIMTAARNETRMGMRMLFPVRSTFFYDSILGAPINMLMSGMSMFPPILRRRRALPFNEWALIRCVAELQHPGTVVGIHPEGTRNKTPDPYTLHRVTRGVGRVALAATDVPVVPIFVLGAGNNLAREIARNLLRPGRYPLDVVFGPRVELSDLYARAEEPRAWKEASARCVAAIEALGQVQQELARQRGTGSTGPEVAHH